MKNTKIAVISKIKILFIVSVMIVVEIILVTPLYFVRSNEASLLLTNTLGHA